MTRTSRHHDLSDDEFELDDSFFRENDNLITTNVEVETSSYHIMQFNCTKLVLISSITYSSFIIFLLQVLLTMDSYWILFMFWIVFVLSCVIVKNLQHVLGCKNLFWLSTTLLIFGCFCLYVYIVLSSTLLLVIGSIIGSVSLVCLHFARGIYIGSVIDSQVKWNQNMRSDIIMLLTTYSIMTTSIICSILITLLSYASYKTCGLFLCILSLINIFSTYTFQFDPLLKRIDFTYDVDRMDPIMMMKMITLNVKFCDVQEMIIFVKDSRLILYLPYIFLSGYMQNVVILYVRAYISISIACYNSYSFDDDDEDDGSKPLSYHFTELGIILFFCMSSLFRQYIRGSTTILPSSYDISVQKQQQIGDKNKKKKKKTVIEPEKEYMVRDTNDGQGMGTGTDMGTPPAGSIALQPLSTPSALASGTNISNISPVKSSPAHVTTFQYYKYHSVVKEEDISAVDPCCNLDIGTSSHHQILLSSFIFLLPAITVLLEHPIKYVSDHHSDDIACHSGKDKFSLVALIAFVGYFAAMHLDSIQYVISLHVSLFDKGKKGTNTTSMAMEYYWIILGLGNFISICIYGIFPEGYYIADGFVISALVIVSAFFIMRV